MRTAKFSVIHVYIQNFKNEKRQLISYPASDSGLIDAKKYFLELCARISHEEIYAVLALRIGQGDFNVLEKCRLIGQYHTERILVDKLGWSKEIASTSSI